MKKKLYGNTGGLKANQIHRLENLYRRRTPPELIITPELAREISKLSPVARSNSQTSPVILTRSSLTVSVKRMASFLERPFTSSEQFNCA